jgi:hypothetical protein
MPLFNPTKTAEEEYQGTDHTAVNNPKAGDYTLEANKLVWFYDGTSWARRTPVHWGLLYPADSFSEAFTLLSGSSAAMLPAIPGDLIAYTVDRNQAGNLTYTGRYNGTSWENISGVDSSEAVYWLDQAINDVSGRITTEVGTLNDTIGNLSFGLQYFQESTQTYSGTTFNILEALSASPDVGLVFNPKGSGALLAQIPDGTVANGNLRGLYSWDFQTYRTSADQVASGTGSLILWASSSKAGNYSMVFSGDNCFANNIQAIILGGSYVTNTGIRSVVCNGGGGSLATGVSVTGNNCFVGNGRVISIAGNSNSVLNGEKVTITSSAGVTIAGNGANLNGATATITNSDYSFGFSTATSGGSWYLTDSFGSFYFSNGGGIQGSQRSVLLGGGNCTITSGLFSAIFSSLNCTTTSAYLSSILSSNNSSLATDYSTLQGANSINSRTHHSQASGYFDASRHTVDMYYTGAVTAGQTVTLRAQNYANDTTLDTKKLISIGANQVITGQFHIIAKVSGSIVYKAAQSGSFFVTKDGANTPVVTLYGWAVEYGDNAAYTFSLINSPTVANAIEIRVTCANAQTVIAKATVEYEIIG